MQKQKENGKIIFLFKSEKNEQVHTVSASVKYDRVKKCTNPSNEFLLHACRKTDERTDGHTSRPSLLINVIVPPHLRYVGLIKYSRTANIYSSELDAAPRGYQWLHVPTKGGGHEATPATGCCRHRNDIPTLYTNCQHLQKRDIALYLPKRNIQKESFYFEIVIKESHGQVSSSY